jgi:hypothetical protein
MAQSSRGFFFLPLDLVGLCKNGIIPSEYHEYYKSLPANNSVIDTLVDTDVEEQKVDSDQD